MKDDVELKDELKAQIRATQATINSLKAEKSSMQKTIDVLNAQTRKQFIEIKYLENMSIYEFIVARMRWRFEQFKDGR